MKKFVIKTMVVLFACFTLVFFSGCKHKKTNPLIGGNIINYPIETESTLRIKVERLKLIIAQKNNNQDEVNSLSVAIATNDYYSGFTENFWGRRPCMCGPAMCPWGKPVVIELNDGDDIEVDSSLINLEPSGKGVRRVFLTPAVKETEDVSTSIKINGQSLDVIVNDHEIKIPLR